MKNKIYSLLIALCFIFTVSMSSMTLNAATIVNNEAELVSEINSATDGVEKSIEVASSIEVENMVEIPSNKIIKLSASNSNILLTRAASYIDHILYVDNTASLTLENIILDGQRDTRSDIAGSLIYSKGELNIETGTVLENNAISVATSYGTPSDPLSNYSSGAGVFAKGTDAKVTVNGGVINNNHSLTYRPSVSDATYFGGGGFNLQSGAELYVNGGSFTNNDSVGPGGAIHSSGSVTITGGLFEKNKSDQNGGALAVQGKRGEKFASLTVTGGEFKQNHSDANSNGGGGAIYIIQLNNYYPSMPAEDYVMAPAKITGGLFEGNTAKQHGAGIYYGYTEMEVGGTVVMRGNAAGNYGGAIACSEIVSPSQRTNLTINGGTYTENTAGSGGGAVYVMSSKDLAPKGLIINGGEFTKNTAKIHGGAIYTVAQANTYITGTEANPVIISDNTASVGGGIYSRGNIWDSDSTEVTEYKLIMKNVTVKNNKAILDGRNPNYYGIGGGIGLGTDTLVELDNVLITKNTAESMGGAIGEDTNSYPWYNRIIASGNTQIGVDRKDNGVYLLTYAFSTDIPGQYDYYRHIIELKGEIGENAFYNVEEAQENVVNPSKTEIENTIGRVIIKKQNGEDITAEEFKKMYYQGPELRAVINQDNKSEAILEPKGTGELTIDDDFKDDDGVVVIYRTGDTGEKTPAYSYEYDLKLNIDGVAITSEQLSSVTWTVEAIADFKNDITYATIADGTNKVIAKKSGVVRLTADYNGSTASIDVVIPGDINRDGNTNGRDISSISKYVFSGVITDLGKDDKYLKLLSDLNGDGNIDGQDISKISFMIFGSIKPSN
ncbi:putative outer membrane repeat protein [Bacilli bacterium PM5-3]|nr:putative outer membrane repeat protein [Bacilli bacterium PM5-3]